MKCFRSAKPRSFFIALRLATAIAFTFTLVAPPPLYAQNILNLPAPGTMVGPSPAFTPTILLGLEIDPNNPFKFQFIVDRGDENLTQEELKKESEKVIRYFLAGLAVPENELWVNLSPYEEDRIIDDTFGQTEMGRDLLAQDYMLKQITASLIYPEDELGRAFWQRIYKKAYEAYGTTTVPMNTFNKVWIMPDKATVYEHQNKAVIIESEMKVMLEQDYVSLENNLFNTKLGLDKKQNEQTTKEASTISSDVVREIVLPELRKEINTGKNFTQLRQIYNSLVLANWFKSNLKQSVLNKLYSDKNKVGGIATNDEKVIKEIYDQYLAAFKKGVCDYMKIEYDPYMKKQLPRKYFSGGAIFDMKVEVASVGDPRVKSSKSRFEKLKDRIFAVSASVVGGVARGVTSGVKNTGNFVKKIIPSDTVIKTLAFATVLNMLSPSLKANNFNVLENSMDGNKIELVGVDESAKTLENVNNVLAERGKGSPEVFPPTVDLGGAMLVSLSESAPMGKLSIEPAAEYQVIRETDQAVLGYVRFLSMAPNSKEVRYQLFNNINELLVYGENGTGYWKQYGGGDPYASTGRISIEKSFLKEQGSFTEQLAKVYLLLSIIPDKNLDDGVLNIYEGIIEEIQERILGAKSPGKGQRTEDPVRLQRDGKEITVEVLGEKADTVTLIRGPQSFKITFPAIPTIPDSIPPPAPVVANGISLDGTGSLNNKENIPGNPIVEQIDFSLQLLDELSKDDPDGTRIYNFDPLGEAPLFKDLKGTRTIAEQRVLLNKIKGEVEAKSAKGIQSREQGAKRTDLLGRLRGFLDSFKSMLGKKNVFIVTDWYHDLEDNKNAPWSMEKLIADGSWKVIAEEYAKNDMTVFSVDVSKEGKAPLRDLLENWDNERVARGERRVFYFINGDYQGLLNSYKTLQEQQKKEEAERYAKQVAERNEKKKQADALARQSKFVELKTGHSEYDLLQVKNNDKVIFATNDEGEELTLNETKGPSLAEPTGEVDAYYNDQRFFISQAPFKDLQGATATVTYEAQKHPFESEKPTVYMSWDISATTEASKLFLDVQNEIDHFASQVELVGATTYADKVDSYTGTHKGIKDYLKSRKPGNFTNGLEGLIETIDKALALKDAPDYIVVITDGQFNFGEKEADLSDLATKLRAKGIQVIVVGNADLRRHMNKYFMDINKKGPPKPKDLLKGENYPEEREKGLPLRGYGDIDASSVAKVLFSLAVTGDFVLDGKGTMAENLSVFNQMLQNTCQFEQQEFVPNLLVVNGINNKGKKETRVYKINIKQETPPQEGHIVAEPIKGSGIVGILNLEDGRGVVPYVNPDGSVILFDLLPGKNVQAAPNNNGDNGPSKKASSAAGSSGPNGSDENDFTKGGIDFNAEQFNLKTKGEGIDMNIPFDEKMLENFDPNMIAPVIIQIVPIANPQMILGLSDQEPQSPG